MPGYAQKKKTWRTGYQKTYKKYKRPTAAQVQRWANPRTGGFLGIETKFLDSAVDAVTVNAAADASTGEKDPTLGSCLNSILQGNGESQRIGRKVTLKSVELDGVISAVGNADAADAPQQASYFIALVLDKQTNGVQMNSEDCFLNKGATALLAASPLRDMEFLSRFRVLKTVKLRAPRPYAFTDGTGTGSISGFQIPWKMRASLNIPVNFVAAAGGIGDIVDNSLHVIAWASSVELAPKISYNSRVKYVG